MTEGHTNAFILGINERTNKLHTPAVDALNPDEIGQTNGLYEKGLYAFTP